MKTLAETPSGGFVIPSKAEFDPKKAWKGGKPLKDRGKIQLDRTYVKKLAQLNCTDEEIAAFFEVNRMTIANGYEKELKEGRELAKFSIRKAQFRIMEGGSGSCQMAIHLGKHYLDQNDRKQMEDTVKDILLDQLYTSAKNQTRELNVRPELPPKTD
jgi:hypothetical protein